MITNFNMIICYESLMLLIMKISANKIILFLICFSFLILSYEWKVANNTFYCVWLCVWLKLLLFKIILI